MQASTAADAVRDAAAVLADYGAGALPSTQRLGSIKDGNLFRDFNSIVRSDVEFQSLTFPVLNNDGERIYAEWPILAPHAMFQYLAQKQALISTLMGNVKVNLSEFWSWVATTPLGQCVLKDFVEPGAPDRHSTLPDSCNSAVMQQISNHASG